MFKKILKSLHLANNNKVAEKVNYWGSLPFDAQSYISNDFVNVLYVEKESYDQFKKWLTVENSILA